MGACGFGHVAELRVAWMPGSPETAELPSLQEAEKTAPARLLVRMSAVGSKCGSSGSGFKIS